MQIHHQTQFNLHMTDVTQASLILVLFHLEFRLAEKKVIPQATALVSISIHIHPLQHFPFTPVPFILLSPVLPSSWPCLILSFACPHPTGSFPIHHIHQPPSSLFYSSSICCYLLFHLLLPAPTSPFLLSPFPGPLIWLLPETSSSLHVSHTNSPSGYNIKNSENQGEN